MVWIRSIYIRELSQQTPILYLSFAHEIYTHLENIFYELYEFVKYEMKWKCEIWNEIIWNENMKLFLKQLNCFNTPAF